MISSYSSTFLNAPVSFARKNVCCVCFAHFSSIICYFLSATSVTCLTSGAPGNFNQQEWAHLAGAIRSFPLGFRLAYSKVLCVWCLCGLVVSIADSLLALPNSGPDSGPGGQLRLQPRHFGGWRCLRTYTEQKVIGKLHCYLRQEFLWMVFLMRSVLKKHGFPVLLCFSSFFTLWCRVEKSSYCDNVLEDNAPKWGGWVKHDRGAEVTQWAWLTALRGGWISL